MVPVFTIGCGCPFIQSSKNGNCSGQKQEDSESVKGRWEEFGGRDTLKSSLESHLKAARAMLEGPHRFCAPENKAGNDVEAEREDPEQISLHSYSSDP